MAKQKLSSTQLRALAEMVDGNRGTPYAYAKGRRIWMSPTEDPDPNANIIPVDTRDVVAKRRCITQITVQLDDGNEYTLFPPEGTFPDALFWTESAVQKFLVPYYAAKSAADPRVDRVIRTLLDTFNGKLPKKPPVDDGAPASDGTVEVFALAHLPKSEYTGETGAAAALDSLAVVRLGEGGVTVERLPEYLSPAEGK